MPPGQCCSVCRQPGHNRVKCEEARKQREAEVSGLRQRIAELRAKLLQAREAAQRWRERAEDADEAGRAAQAEAGQWRHRAVEAEEDARAWQREVFAAEDDAAAVRDELAKSEEKRNWLQQLLSTRNRQVSELQHQLVDVETKLGELETERDRLRAERDAEAQSAAEHGRNADIAESLINGYEAALEDLRVEVRELRAQAGQII